MYPITHNTKETLSILAYLTQLYVITPIKMTSHK